jgi:hypothetical protein
MPRAKPPRLFPSLSRRGTFLIARHTFRAGDVFTPDLGRISTNAAPKTHLWHPLLNLAKERERPSRWSMVQRSCSSSARSGAWPTSPRLGSPLWLRLVSRWAVLGDGHRIWSELFSYCGVMTFSYGAKWTRKRFEAGTAWGNPWFPLFNSPNWDWFPQSVGWNQKISNFMMFHHIVQWMDLTFLLIVFI